MEGAIKVRSDGIAQLRGYLTDRTHPSWTAPQMGMSLVFAAPTVNWLSANISAVASLGAAQCLYPSVLPSALANKLASIAWTVLAQEHSSKSRVSKVAA